MTDRPILMSAPTVISTIREVEEPGTGKTETRRIIKDAPQEPGWILYEKTDGTRKWFGPNGYPSMPCVLRFAVGDRLWVRETLVRSIRRDWFYAADQAPVCLAESDTRVSAMIAWAHHKEADTCVSIHMPRWASRLTLTVTDVRVERLQGISEKDAIAEGIERDCGDGCCWNDYEADIRPSLFSPIDSYRSLWGRINGAGSWAENPWIVAVSFRPELRNIDSGTRA